MKKTLLIFAFIVVLLLSEQAPHNNTALAQSNQTLTVGTTDSVASSLDPANAYDYFGWEIIRSLGSGLVDYRPGASGPNDIIPDLAKNWSVSSDGLQYTFSLRQGVKYDDGTEFNATHVKYTFDRDMGMADPDGAFVGIGFSDIIQSVTVVDTYTVKFTLKIPFGAFLSLIAGQECVMVDPKYAPMHGTSWDYTTDTILYTEGNARASNPMGLGPYMLSSWTRVAGKDSQMVLTADPNYWNASAGIPKTKKIIIGFYADSTSLALAIAGGQVDIAFRQLSITDINTMKTNSNLTVWQGTGPFIQYLCFQEKYAPFNETNIRQAVGAAINRTALVNTVFQGQAQNLYSLIPNGMVGHTDAFQSLGDPNYTRTQELLAPFGYNATNKLTFNLWYETSGHYPQSPQQAQVLKSSMEASGVITVNLQGVDWPTFGSARRSETMQAFIMGWYPDYIDPDDYVFPFLDSSGGSWIHLHYSNPRMDQLVEWARGNTSLSVRTALYSQIQDLMVKDSPIIPLYQGLVYAVSNKDITGIYLDITCEFRYQLIAWRARVTSFVISPNPFSPNADGSKDNTTIKATFNFVVDWNLQIRNSSGTTLRTWTGTGSSLSIVWNGKNSTGFKVPDGTYTVRLSGKDLLGVAFTTKSATVTVDTKQPTVTGVSVVPASFNPKLGHTTMINYTLSESCYVTIKIYNSTGSLKRTLLNGVLQTSGLKSIVWNGKDSSDKIVPTGTYTIKMYVADKAGNKATLYPIIKTVTVDMQPPAVTGVSVTPSSFKPILGQTTTINYTLSESCYVTIKIYNSTGTLKRTLLNNVLQASGLHSVVWNGKTSSNVIVPLGTYTIKIYVIDKAGNKATSYPIIKTVTVT